MKRRKVTALLLAATLAVTGIGQTAMVWGSDFSDEFFGESVSEEIVVEEQLAEVGESDSTENAFDSEEPAEEFVSEEAETGLTFADEDGQEEVSYDYAFPRNEIKLLPNWGEWINRYPEWYASDGNAGNIEFTDIKVENDDPEHPAISVEMNAEGSGWDIRALQYGHAVITLTYTPVGETREATYRIDVNVDRDVYNISIDSDTGTGNLLPGDTLTLNANVWVNSAENNEQEQEKASQVQVEWTVEEGAEFVECSEDENGFHVTAKQDAANQWARITATGYVSGDNGRAEVCREDWYVSINNLYYEIKPFDRDVESNLAVGESVVIAPELYGYDKEYSQKEYRVNEKEFSWRWAWGDTNAIEIKDATGKIITPGESEDAYGIAPFTITKLKREGTDAGLCAEFPGEKKGDAVAGRVYSFDHIDYDVWFNSETLRGDEHYTWIYTNEQQTVSLNTENLRGDYELVWQAGNYGQNDEFCEDTSIPYTISADGTSITLNGAAIPAESNFNIRVTVMAGGNEVAGTDFWVDVKEPRYDYGELPYFYEGSTAQLPYWGFGINRYVNCYVEDVDHPDGTGIPVQVTNVTAVNAADDEGYKPVVTVNPWEDGNGWSVDMERMGHAIVTVDYTTWDGNAASYTIDVYVGGDVYDMSVSSDTATNKMLPGEGLTLTADVYQRSFDWENGHSDITNPEDVWVEWEYDSESDTYTFTPNGNQLTVKAEKDGRGTNVRAVAYVKDENGNPIEVASCDWWAEVFTAYYTISENTLESGRTWGCNQKIELNPELTLFNEENVGGTTVEEPVRYRVEGDWWAFAFVDADGNEVEITDENCYAEAPFTVVRKTTDGFRVTLVAELFEENRNPYEVERRDFWMDGLDYGVWFSEEGKGELRGGGGYTWIYSDETKYHVCLNTNNLEGYEDYDIEWRIDDALAGTYRFDGDGITFDGTKLSDIIYDDPFNGGFDVEVIVKAGGEEVSRNGFRADVRNPYDEVQEIRDTDMLRGDTRVFDGNILHYYIENKENPYGGSYELTITNIAVEDLREEPDEENPVLVAVQNDDGIWEMTCQNYGPALVRINAENEEYGITREFEFRIDVSSDLYRLSGVDIEPGQVILPGTDMVMQPHIVHISEGEAESELNTKEFTIESIDYDDNWFDVTTDADHNITVHAKETFESIESDIHVRLQIPLEDGNTYTTEYGITVWIRPEYVKVEGAEKFVTEPGAAVTAEDMGAVLKVYSTANPEGKVVENASFKLDILEGSAYMDVNEAQNVITVKEGALSAEEGPVTEYVAIWPSDEYTLEDIPREYWIPVTICNHKYSEWTTVSTASIHSAEIQKRTCSVCGKEETREVGAKLTPVLVIPGKLTSFSIQKGQTVSFAVTMAKGDALASCTSSKKSVVKVAGVDKTTGTISLKAAKSGTAKIKITLASGMAKTYTVKVVTGTIKTSKIAVASSKVTLEKGKSFRLNATVKPFTSTQKITYTTSDKKIAAVSSSGKIKAVAPGTATITAVSGSKKATCKVTVTGIANVKSSVTVAKGKTLTLKPTLYDITDKVTYTSSNTKVATVSSKGKIKGVKKGTATITVTAGNYTVKCKVTVK